MTQHNVNFPHIYLYVYTVYVIIIYVVYFEAQSYEGKDNK